MQIPRKRLLEVALCLSPICLYSAQTTPTLDNILARLDRLEKENATLREEVRSLREDDR